MFVIKSIVDASQRVRCVYCGTYFERSSFDDETHCEKCRLLVRRPGR